MPKLLEDFVTPSREDMATFDVDEAKKIDLINKEIYRRNKMLVNKAKMVLRAAAPHARSVQNLEPPAVPIEYARKFRDMIEKEREAAAAYEERMAAQSEREAARPDAGPAGAQPGRR